jgi:hypothetical protein
MFRDTDGRSSSIDASTTQRSYAYIYKYIYFFFFRKNRSPSTDRALRHRVNRYRLQPSAARTENVTSHSTLSTRSQLFVPNRSARCIGLENVAMPGTDRARVRKKKNKISVYGNGPPIPLRRMVRS